MRLTDSELRAVFARAEEIQRASRQSNEWNAERAAVIGAGEEVGLSRTAIERALNERHDLSAAPPAAGALAWAQSVDGKFYVAEVVSVSESGARVRFLRGSEYDVTHDQLRPCTFIPGERVVVNWPWWGPWTGSVVAYNPAEENVKVSDGWGSTETFHVSEIWLAPTKNPAASRTRVYVKLVGAGVAIGTVIGALATMLLMR